MYERLQAFREVEVGSPTQAKRRQLSAGRQFGAVSLRPELPADTVRYFFLAGAAASV
jgi:hypothetical protein